MNIGMLLFPDLTQLDLTGPHQIFSMAQNVQPYLIAQDLNPVISGEGLKLTPDVDYANAPDLDIIFVPGGSGVYAMLTDDPFMEFLRERGQKAQYVTSVCTGALLLAAAGLLDGYRATTHWRSLDLLRMFEPVEVVEERVVIDRNRMTGGGVTAGIDFGLVLIAELFGEQAAKSIQLSIEYNPAPPYNCGSPATADADILASVIQNTEGQFQKRHTLLAEILDQKSN